MPAHYSPPKLPQDDSADPLSRLSRARVMMVDDDPIMVEVVRTFLEEAGYLDFVGISDPAAAVDMIRKDRPDVLLLDLLMPGVNGFDILRAVRANPNTQFVPVIVMTSASDARTKLRVLELGATDFLQKPVDASELTLRLRNTLAFKAYRDRLEYFDPLTALPNRRLFLQELDNALARRGRHGNELALLQLNIDGFKRINESLGHHAGDEALRMFAARLQVVIRESDQVGMDRGSLPAGQGLVSRVGADEFTILLDDLHRAEDAGTVAQRIHKALAAPFQIAGIELYLNAAIGVAITPLDGDDSKTLFQHANIAVSQAKQRGRNAMAFYASKLDDSAREHLTIDSDLRHAAERGEFRLFYQPKFDLSTGRICGAEALIRWNHPTRGLLLPGRFVPVAEAGDLIVDIGVWVMGEACSQVKRWQRRGIDVPVSVNISSVHLRDNQVLYDARRALLDSGVDPHLLTMELTESSLMRDPVSGGRVLAGLRALGVRVSLDDFGTGYSSLSHLKRMPLDELKIDKSFIDDVAGDVESAMIVKAIIAMAHTLRLQVVAEGVEQPAQAQFLRQSGCDAAQGFLYSVPLPAAEFEKLLAVHPGQPLGAETAPTGGLE